MTARCRLTVPHESAPEHGAAPISLDSMLSERKCAQRSSPSWLRRVGPTDRRALAPPRILRHTRRRIPGPSEVPEGKPASGRGCCTAVEDSNLQDRSQLSATLNSRRTSHGDGTGGLSPSGGHLAAAVSEGSPPRTTEAEDDPGISDQRHSHRPGPTGPAQERVIAWGDNSRP